MRTTFKTPSGQYDTQIVSHVLVTRVRGPWSRVQMERWIEHSCIDLAQLADLGRFGIVMVMSDSMMCDPGAAQLLRKRLHELVTTSRLVCSAVVADPGLRGRQFAAEALAQVHRDLCPFRVFDTEAEALTWNGLLIGGHSAHEQGELPDEADLMIHSSRHREVAQLYSELARAHQRMAELSSRTVVRLPAEVQAQLAAMRHRANTLSARS